MSNKSSSKLMFDANVEDLLLGYRNGIDLPRLLD